MNCRTSRAFIPIIGRHLLHISHLNINSTVRLFARIGARQNPSTGEALGTAYLCYHQRRGMRQTELKG